MMDVNQRSMIAGIVANELIKKFKIRNEIYPVLLIGITKLINIVPNIQKIFNLLKIEKYTNNKKYYCLLCVILYSLYISFKGIRLMLVKEIHHVEIIDKDVILFIEKFIKQYPNYFKFDNNLLMVSKDGLTVRRPAIDLSCTSFRRNSIFDIEKLNIKGNISYTKIDEINCKMIIDYTYIDNTQKTSFENTIDKMMDMANTRNIIERKHIILYHYPITDNRVTFNYIMYKGEKRSMVMKEKIFLDSFFHKDKDMLWNMIKNININKEYYKDNRLNLLLYGPPGTGKSTFPYRVAMCLDRHLISLKISGMKRSYLYQVIMRPFIDNTTYESKDCIFVLDEVDSDIVDLRNRELIKSYKRKKKETNLIELIKTNDTNNISDNKNNSEDDDYDNDLAELVDVLKIVQGSIPLNGTIIMATTNKYDKIYEICPDLFRPGRLQPIYFGYVEEETIQDISMYYFGEKIKLQVPKNHKLPTSKIIEIAIYFKDLNKTVKDFGIELNKLFSLDEYK